MVFYYEQKEPIFYALVSWLKTTTIFGLVLKRPEFWFFLAGHCTAMAMFKTGIWHSGELTDLSGTWEAVSATQMFMVFLLTFYNGHCYDRYLRLYHNCMEALDGTIFFVQEVVISMAPPSVEAHRIRAVKYACAMLHIFFVGLTGRMKNKADWREIVQRGLLTKLEAEQLQHYPSQSIETVLVVSTWAMQIIDKGLEDDAFWHSRSMRIAHTHNRMQAFMTQLLRSFHEIGDEIANPIPFQLYHLMNIVLMFNLFLLCTLTAVFATYQTVFPLMISIMFFLGLREVAGNLSDPFHGRGFGSDFPVASFVQYGFDTSVCLLEAFRHGDPEAFASKLATECKEFTNEQLRHTTPDKVIYPPKYDATVQMAFGWNQEGSMTEMEGHPDGPEEIMTRTSMNPDEFPEVRKRRRRNEDDDLVMVHKPGFFGRLFGKSSRPQHVNEKAGAEGTDLLEAEIRLGKSQKRNAGVEEEICKWREEVMDLRTLLEHRLKVGHDLNLPVDEIVSNAMNKLVEPDDSKTRRVPPEFTSFDEARAIVKHAADPHAVV